MIRSAFFRGFTATDAKVLQAAAQILDMPPAELELRRNGGAAIVRMRGDDKMNQLDKTYLFELAEWLDDAHRIGEDEDLPEGTRYIQISDTLAKMVTKALRAIANREENR